MPPFQFNLPRGPHGMKWGSHPPGVLPLWVADLDIAPPPFVAEGLAAFLQQNDLGYTNALPAFRQSVALWYQTRYLAPCTEEMVVPMPGVVPGLYAFLLAFGKRGAAFLIQTPVYPYFLDAGASAGMRAIQVPLTPSPRRYEIDFEALEKACTPSTRAILLCHPHNPSGRLFSRRELESILDFACRHDLMVLSDEIWSDWIFSDEPFTSFISLGPEAVKRSVVLGAATKTFNIPGLGAAWALIPDPALRERFRGAIKGLLPSANHLGLLATTWVQERGLPWFDAVHAHIAENRRFAEKAIADSMPQVGVTPAEATYLMWLDFRKTPWADQPAREILRRGRVALSEGSLFGAGGEGFARINLGTTREVLGEALSRMADALAKA